MPHTLEAYNEQACVLAMKKGDEKAFEQIYHHHRYWLYNNILHMVKVPDYAGEVLQDVFLKLWMNRLQIDTSKQLNSLLFKIAQNAMYDFFRKAAHQKHIKQTIQQASCIDLHSQNPIEQEIFLKEARGALEEMLSHLPEKCRQVFVLCKLEGRSYEEVAQLLNISPATINNHIVKGTRLLKKQTQLPQDFIMLIFSFLYCF